jgi:hypothetical protein
MAKDVSRKRAEQEARRAGEATAARAAATASVQQARAQRKAALEAKRAASSAQDAAAEAALIREAQQERMRREQRLQQAQAQAQREAAERARLEERRAQFEEQRLKAREAEEEKARAAQAQALARGEARRRKFEAEANAATAAEKAKREAYGRAIAHVQASTAPTTLTKQDGRLCGRYGAPAVLQSATVKQALTHALLRSASAPQTKLHGTQMEVARCGGEVAVAPGTPVHSPAPKSTPQAMWRPAPAFGDPSPHSASQPTTYLFRPFVLANERRPVRTAPELVGPAVSRVSPRTSWRAPPPPPVPVQVRAPSAATFKPLAWRTPPPPGAAFEERVARSAASLVRVRSKGLRL